MTPDHIEPLLEEYLRLSATPENLRRLRCWEPEAVARDQWHGRPRAGAFQTEGAVPVTVDLQNTFWLQLFPQNLAECYQDPRAYLRFFLQRRIAQFQRLADDTPLDRVIPIYLGTPFEPSLFGVPLEYYPDNDPGIAPQPVIHSAADLARLGAVDFYHSGLMPLAHRFYGAIRNLAGSEFTVVFTEWLRGPLGVAQYLYGYENMLAALNGDPAFATDLLEGVTTARQNWFRARARFLGQPVSSGSLFNDEVDANVIGARHYRQHLARHELVLGRFHGRISYWHSCGNTGPLAADVAGLNAVELLDISAWTDVAQVLPAVNGRIPRFEIRFHPLRDVIEATPEQMETRVRRVLTDCRQHHAGAITLRSSAIQPWRSLAADFAQIQRWIEVVRAETQSPAEAAPISPPAK